MTDIRLSDRRRESYSERQPTDTHMRTDNDRQIEIKVERQIEKQIDIKIYAGKSDRNGWKLYADNR